MGELTPWSFGMRVIILYFLVMIALRVMGKREIGKLSIFDFVVSVMIAELSTLPMEDTKVTLWRSAASIAILVCLQLIVAYLSMKSHRFRHFIDGEATVLVEHGRINDREMRSTRYTMHDLLMQLREKGVSDVADVEFAILETSGKLSVFPRAEQRPLTAADLGIPANAQTQVAMPLVTDGTPVAKTLTVMKKDEAWLRDELAKRGYSSLEEVFYASIDKQGRFYIDERDRKDPAERDGNKKT